VPEVEGKKSLARRGLNRILHLMARVLPGARSLRPFLHRMRGARIGRGVFIGDDVYLENEYPERVEIGDNVELGLRSVILAHLRGPGRVVIKHDAWIGACAVITAPSGRLLTIGEGAVIGACTVVTADVPDRAFVRPPSPEHVANVSVPLTSAPSYFQFVRGLRPLRHSPRKADNGISPDKTA